MQGFQKGVESSRGRKGSCVGRAGGKPQHGMAVRAVREGQGPFGCNADEQSKQMSCSELVPHSL